VVSFREFFIASRTSEFGRDGDRLVTVGERGTRRNSGGLFPGKRAEAIPVVDCRGSHQGIVTVDYIVDVVVRKANLGAQKFGGMEALEEP